MKFFAFIFTLVYAGFIFAAPGPYVTATGRSGCHYDSVAIAIDRCNNNLLTECMQRGYPTLAYYRSSAERSSLFCGSDGLNDRATVSCSAMCVMEQPKRR